jgi:outer membrane receptor protein involved in Fe transport
MRRITWLKTGLLLACGALVVAATPGWAQTVSEGTITGTVMEATGAVIPGAALKLTGPALVTGERTATSGPEGKFVFMSVPPGEYRLTASLTGFKTVTAAGLLLERGASVDVPIKMELGSYEEQIVVTSETPLMDTRSSTISTTFNDRLLAKVPTARNAFYDLTLTAPGMGDVGSNESWLPSPTAYGSANSANITLVNGVNTTNPRGSAWGSLVTVNYNTVEEVKVLSLGTRAEYGNYSGAAIDVITKSGGNEFHGDAAYYTQVGNAADNSVTSFGDTWYFPDPQFDITTNPVDSWEASITFGGPIKKDALWFYAGYGHPYSNIDTPIKVLDENWQADLYDLKLTGDFATNHRLWLGLHYEDTKAGNVTWGVAWDASMVYQSENKNFTPQFQYQWVIGPTDILSFKFLAFDTDQTPSIKEEYGHPGYINWGKWLVLRDMGVNGDFPYVEAQKSNRQTYQADISHYAEDFLGSHDLKFGVQYTKAEGNWMGGYFQGYANMAYPYPYNYGPATSWWWNGPETWQWGTDENPVFPMYNTVTTLNPWLTVRKSDSAGAFFDDTWVVNDRFTVNLGLRYDKMTAKYGEGKVYEFFDTPSDVNNPKTLRTRAGSNNVFDWNVWSPRIGVAWTLTDDRKTVLRAHLGRYYAAMGVESLRRFGPDMEEGTSNTWLHTLPASLVDLNGNGYWDPEETEPASRLLYGRQPDGLLYGGPTDTTWSLEVEPGTGSPYTDQFNFSLQRQLGSDLAIEFSYIYKKEKNLLVLQPYNTDTGDFFEWEALPYTTWTGYQTQVWQIKPKDFNGDGTVDVADWHWVADHDGYRTVNAQNFWGGDADRTYTGLQMVLNKRYSHRWQMLAALNWTKTDGFYPRVVDQGWFIDGPMIMDTPFGSTKNHFQNNTAGPALMTPEWALKVSGSYTIPTIETDFGFRLRWDSGRAVWPLQNVPTFQSWMSEIPPGVYLSTAAYWQEPMVAINPDNPDWLPSTTILDLSISKTFRIGNVGQFAISFDALNALNEDSPNQVITSEGTYGMVTSLVVPRIYRLGLKFMF